MGNHFYNYIASTKEKEVVLREWKATGIYEALNLGAVCQLDQEELDSYCTQKEADGDNINDKDGNPKIFLETYMTCLTILMTNHLCKMIFSNHYTNN